MRKILLITVFIVLGALSVEAKTYVVLDKETGAIAGTVDISADSMLDWTKKYIVKEVGEDFRGKQASEIRYEDKKLRLATEQEIAIDKQAKEDAAKVEATKQALEVIGITQADVDKLKALGVAPK